LSAGRSEYGDDLVRQRPRAAMLPIPIPVPAPRFKHLPRLEPYLARPLAPIFIPFLGRGVPGVRPYLNSARIVANLFRT
jgi:hypothetical protein